MLASTLGKIATSTGARAFSLSSYASGSGNYVHIAGKSSRKIETLKMEHKELDKKGGKSTDIAELAESDVKHSDASTLNYTPESLLDGRTVRIYKPAKSAMQSGHQNMKQWKIEFDTQERWENPTMGWGSSSDPMSSIGMAMTFKTKEEAIRFVQRQGWQCFVDENPPKKMQPKSYSINFAWNKRVRRGMK